MEFPTLIDWASPFPFPLLSIGPVHFHWVVFFHFYSNFNRTFCKQTVETLIRCSILRYLIWVCIVCICPSKRKLGLYHHYGLMIAVSIALWPFTFWFGLRFYIPVNSYGHVEKVSSPYLTLFLGKLD